MKIFVVSFNRASDGAISKLVSKMKHENLLVDNYKKADYILAVGDREETFDFVVDRFKENYKIIHLWAGEISQGTHDEVYRHSMTLMSMLQLCTTPTAKERVERLCKDVDKKPNAFVVGNVMLDNMDIDNIKVPSFEYDLVLYNPITLHDKKDVINDISFINKLIEPKQCIWIAPNGDKFSELIQKYTNHNSQPRPIFLGLLKNCRRFITNSSCQYFEAQFLLKPEQIISIGKRNKDRESKYSDMTIPNASENIMKVFRRLKDVKYK